MKIFDTSVMNGLVRDLTWRNQRQEVLTANLANVDTPGYRPLDLDFAEQLKEVLQADNEGMMATSSNHFGSDEEVVDPGDPTVVAQKTEDGLDANGVDLDRQMLELSDNSMRYRTSAKIVSKKLALLKYVINDAR